MWKIHSDYIKEWLDEQEDSTATLIIAALKVLESEGPSLGRPLVDSLKGSKIKNLKELRPASAGRTEIRILFVFDPTRRAVMLLAGDKAEGNSMRDKWAGWYKKSIPKAEKIYERHLKSLEDNDV